MSYSVFPQPTAENLPPGASSLVIKGLANKVGFTQSGLSTGIKIFYADDFDATNNFVIRAKDNNSVVIAPSGEYGAINLSTTENDFLMTQISNSAFSLSWATGSAWKPYYSSEGGYQTIIQASGGGAWLVATTDYVNWTTRFRFASTISPSSYVMGILYGNGVYLARTGMSGHHAFSTDGVNWASRAAIQTNTHSNWLYNGTFYRVQNNNSRVLSTDGLNWTSTSETFSGSPLFSAAGQGYFGFPAGTWTSNRNKIYFGQSGALSAATVPGPSATTGAYQSLAFGNGIWVAAGYNSSHQSTIIVSTNRSTWTVVNPFGTSNSLITEDHYLTYSDNGLFYLSVNNDAAPWFRNKLISKDGINWTTTKLINGAYNMYAQPYVVDGQRMAYVIESAAGIEHLHLGGSPAYYELYNGSTDIIN